MNNPKKSFLKLHYMDYIKYPYSYWRSGLGLCLWVILLLVGCRSRSVSNPSHKAQTTVTTIAVNTQSPSTVLIPPVQFTPSSEPEKSTDLTTRFYSHPNGLFSLQVPKQWSISDNNNSVTFTDTISGLMVQVDTVNTGYVLDSESFEFFIEAQEMKRASEYDNYVVTNRQQVTGSNTIFLTKELSSQKNGKTLTTVYQQQGQGIMILDFLVDKDLFISLNDLLYALINSVKINTEKVSTIPVYSFDQAKLHSNGSFSILIPPYWDIRQSRVENSMVETIASPDKQAIIQTIVYDDGQQMSRNIAGDLVLTLLRENYTKNITVYADEMLADGREKLSWRSTTADYKGITTFEVRKSALFILTIMLNNDPDQLYQNILEEIIDSYTVIDSNGK